MRMIHLVSAVAAVGLLVGCEPNTPSSTDNVPTSAGASKASDVKKEIGEAVEAARQSAAHARARYVTSVEAQLQTMDEQIAELTRKSESLAGDARNQLNDTVASLKEKRREAGERWQEVKNARTEAWQGVKTGFDAVMKDLEREFQNAKSRYS